METPKVDLPDRNGYSALFYAVTLGHMDCALLLLQNGANPNHQDRKLRTAAHCGAAKGQLRTLKVLHQNGASFALQNYRGDLPLHEAAQAGSIDLVEWLLSLYPGTVNSGNFDGRTGLHLAAANGNLELCQAFADAQADPNSLMLFKDSLATPLDLAIAKDHQNVVLFLRKRGAEPASSLPDDVKEKAKQDLIIKAAEGKTKCEVNGILTDSQVSSDGGRQLHSAQTQTRESTSKHRHHHHKHKHRRSTSRKRREDKQPPSSNESEMDHKSQNSSSIIPKSTDTENNSKFLSPEKPVSPQISDQEMLNSSTSSIRKEHRGSRKPGQHLQFQLDDEIEITSHSGSSNRSSNTMDFEPGTLGLVRSGKRGSSKRYMEEKRIFQELANLKRMQVQYGSVQEDVLVRRLMESFIKQYQIKPGQFQFNTFNAWEKFLYDQLKLIYYEERAKQERNGTLNTKFYTRPPRMRNEQKVDQLMKTYGVAPIPIQFSPNLYKK